MADPAPGARRAPSLPFELQATESVLLLARRHWFYFSLRMAIAIGAGALGAVAAALFVNASFGFDGTAGRVAMAVIALWVAYWAVRAYFTWYRYQNDIWVVTDQRLVDSIKRHWFHHQMASADLVDVEDIQVVRAGLFQTMLDFGDVRCQTAGEVPNFVLAGVPAPSQVMATIDSARDAARRSSRATV